MQRAVGLSLSNVEQRRCFYGKFLIFVCVFLYGASMAARAVFTSQSKYLADLWGVGYKTIGLANTYYYATFTLVQIALFFFVNKVSMHKYMLWTVPFAALTTAFIGFSTGVEQVFIYFGLSGAFQAGIYAGCNLMLTKYLPAKLLTKANVD